VRGYYTLLDIKTVIWNRVNVAKCEGLQRKMDANETLQGRDNAQALIGLLLLN
jgi:hypothetical protein